MIWKFLGLQKKLDALFDDGWVSLGLSSVRIRPVPAVPVAGHAAPFEG